MKATISRPYTTPARPRPDRRQSAIGLVAAVILSASSACHPGGAPPRDSLAKEAGVIEVDHVVPATPENLSWGWFPVDKGPAITVRPGEVVEIHTLTGMGASGESDPVTNLGEIGISASEVPEELIAFWETHASRPREGRNGHLITGPVFVEGAEPGDVLEVQILDVRPRVPWGVNFTRARSGVLSEAYPGYRDGDPPLEIPRETPDQEPQEFHIIRTVTVDGRDYGEWASGVRVPLAPFMGILAVAPDLTTESYGVDVPGVRRSGPPGRFGGNLDVKHLTAGTSIFLPVFHSGARFFVGDPHGAQGDGEVSGTAIEQSMIGTFRFVVHKNGAITQPRGESRTHHLIMGLDIDLDRAMRNATFEVVSFLVTHYGLRPSEAFSVASAAVDFTVSEAVDGVQVITAMVPKAIFPDSLRGR
ncbi:MAG TPA: acetamidase/formamidase family protein [Gemmatimonadales bacterium]|nr:acetamidase/formamidase family protein [Gemmatimonadales bacterium]